MNGILLITPPPTGRPTEPLNGRIRSHAPRGKQGLFAALAMVTLSASAQTPLSVQLQSGNFNGYQVKCFGKQTGAINATVAGGTAPYQFSWSNAATTEDLTALAAGYYKLTVTDADSTVAVADITLTEPTPLIVVAEPYTWPNGYNVSCFECYNGSIDVTVGQGVPPYTYLWNDSITTTQDRSSLGAKKHFVVVTDANNCWVKSENVILTQPERRVWDRGGNAGTDPANQYLGTSDSLDVVFKSNGQERLRLKGNGAIGLWGADTTIGPLYRDVDGTLKIGGGTDLSNFPPNKCFLLSSMPYWQTKGNNFTQLCPDQEPVLGTLSASPLKVVTNGQERLRFTADGLLGIGTVAPEAKLHLAGDLLVRGGASGDIVTSHATTTGPVLWVRNYQAAWGLSISPDGKGHILGDWNDPHPVMTFAYNKVGIGTEDMPNDDYSLFVGKGILTERVKVALQSTSEWSDHVFQPNYRLMPLQEVDAFIKEHGHLPGVPSAKQMVEQGLDVVKTDAMLLEKIEELTLHMIAIESRIVDLEQENAALRNSLERSRNTMAR